METKLTNVHVLVTDEGKKKIRANYNGINPAIENENAKTAMTALATLGEGELAAIERTDKNVIFTKPEA